MITQFINKLLYRKESIYSKSERNAIYKQALINFSKFSGLCYAIQYSIYGKEDSFNILDFPEIIKYKPLYKHEKRDYWWKLDYKGADIRKKILKQAIKETE